MGVSADAPETNERFAASLELPYTLIGDGDGRILKAYGVRWPLVGWARRASFVIGPDKKVAARYVNEVDAEAHVSHALEALGRIAGD